MADPEQKTASLEPIAAPAIEKRIFVVPERQVIDRFPEDFIFQLSKGETAALRSQIATSNSGRGGRRYAPYVFTEQGVAMLSGALRSKRAVTVNSEIMRAFVELRRVAGSADQGRPAVGPLITQKSVPTGRSTRSFSQGSSCCHPQSSIPTWRRCLLDPWWVGGVSAALVSRARPAW